MKHIPLSQGMVATVDDDDYELLMQQRWYVIKAGNKLYAGTQLRKSKGKRVLMHRYLLRAKRGQLVDHRNGNTLDNRRTNIRLCTQSQNIANSKRRVSKQHSKYKGVYRKPSGKWYANICLNYKQRYLGTFDTEVEAAEAYDAAARELFGEFANTNFQH